jgi:hypothetical protein
MLDTCILQSGGDNGRTYSNVSRRVTSSLSHSVDFEEQYLILFFAFLTIYIYNKVN